MPPVQAGDRSVPVIAAPIVTGIGSADLVEGDDAREAPRRLDEIGRRDGGPS
jgi:hypothetical protein